MRYVKVALICSLSLFWSLSSSAVEYTVTTAEDMADTLPGDGVCKTSTLQCSLRAAIQEANAHPGTDRVTLFPRTYNLTIAGAQENSSTTGDLDITDNVIIANYYLDPTNCFIDASQINDRVFHIVAPAINVTLEGITIRGGNQLDTKSGGAGICIRCETDNLTKSSYQLNDAGGYVDLSRPSVTLRKVIIDNNHDAVAGGGITNTGLLLIEDSVISNKPLRPVIMIPL